MTSSWSSEFFSRYTPLIREGRIVRADDGSLLFVRIADGEYVRFHDSQVQMDELDQYVHNDIITKASEVDVASDQPLDHQMSTVSQASNDGNTLVQQHHEQEPVDPQNQHLQVQLTIPSSQMQDLIPQALQTFQDVLQMQVSQKHQEQHLQQQEPQGTSNVQTFISSQPLHLRDIQQQLQQHLQQQKCVPASTEQLSQSVAASSDMTLHVVTDLNTQMSEKQELTTSENPGNLKVASIDTSCTSNITDSSQICPTNTDVENSLCRGNESSDNCGIYNFLPRKGACLQSRSTTISSTSGQLSSDVVWMNIKTPEQRLRDKQATQALIGIVSRPDIQAKLTTKTTKKKAVWQEIGEEMGQLGFVFENPGDKCSQKWRNIERTFKDYELSKKTPDMGPKRLPEFYDELSLVLKGKHTYDNFGGQEMEGEGLSSQQLLRDYVSMSSASSSSIQTCGPLSADVNIFSASAQVNALSGNNEMIMSTSHSSTPKERDNVSEAYPRFCSGPQNSQQTPLSIQGPLHTKQITSDDLTTIQRDIQHNKQEINKLQSLITSVHDLLQEQRRDRDAMKIESRQRFAELKSLIEQNQKEKMKFMYDFLKTIQLGKSSKKRGSKVKIT